MSFYGLRLFDFGNKKYAYGVHKRLTPANQSYATQVTIADYVCVLDDSSLTITNESDQANVVVSNTSNLVDVTQFQGANCTVQSGNVDVNSITLFTTKFGQNPLVISNTELVSVSDSYTLVSGKLALVIDGTLNVPTGNTNFEANSQVDIYSVGPRETDTTLTGTGKLIVFNIA
ncbi:hypothetical protein OAU13_00875 [bacterium]|nr:hypothetical protein [bacterium]